MYNIYITPCSHHTGSFSKVVLSHRAVNQVFFGVFLMFLAFFHSKIWAKIHFGTFKPYKQEKLSKYAILSQPRNVTSFEDEIFQLFSCLYGLKVPKWICAHILLWKKAKNIRKTPKNT